MPASAGEGSITRSRGMLQACSAHAPPAVRVATIRDDLPCRHPVAGREVPLPIPTRSPTLFILAGLLRTATEDAQQEPARPTWLERTALRPVPGATEPQAATAPEAGQRELVRLFIPGHLPQPMLRFARCVPVGAHDPILHHPRRSPDRRAMRSGQRAADDRPSRVGRRAIDPPAATIPTEPLPVVTARSRRARAARRADRQLCRLASSDGTRGAIGGDPGVVGSGWLEGRGEAWQQSGSQWSRGTS